MGAFHVILCKKIPSISNCTHDLKEFREDIKTLLMCSAVSKGVKHGTFPFVQQMKAVQ